MPLPSNAYAIGAAPFFPRNFFWHMSCDISGVARKFHHQKSFGASSVVAEMNRRLAAIQLTGRQHSAAVKKIPALRRRLPVMMITHAPQTVIMRHAASNLGNVSAAIPAPARSPRSL